MDSLVKEWALFFDRCLENRITAEQFDSVVPLLHIRSPLPGRKIAELLLKPRAAAVISFDPRILIYVERLLALKKVDASDVLASAFQFSKDRAARAGEVLNPYNPPRWSNPPELEEVIFHRLHKAFSGDHMERPATNAEGFRTLCIVPVWMSAMVTSHTGDSMMQALAGIQQHQQQSINLREAMGMLLVGLMENPKILQLLTKDELKGGRFSFSVSEIYIHYFACCLLVQNSLVYSMTCSRELGVRKQFAQALSTFIPFLSQTSIPIANRLELSQKEHGLQDKALSRAGEEANENAKLEVAALQVEAVVDLPHINTRAGLYVFLSSLVILEPPMCLNTTDQSSL
jgi:mediator of RNA polymerase II transcription subunit 5